jgi:hypothetical protein
MRLLTWPFLALGRGVKWLLWTSPGAVRLWSWVATIGMSLFVALEANAARHVVGGIFSLLFFWLRDALFS